MVLETNLEGTCVLVTGGTRGIGKSIVEAFLRQSANVCYCSRSATGTEFTNFSGTANGARAVGSSVDVSSQDELKAWVATCGNTFGRIDTVISNASPLHTKPGAEYFLESFTVEVLGFANLVDAAMPYLEKSPNGSVIVMSSFLGREVFLDEPTGGYGPCKAAQLQYVNELSHYHGSKGIRVNAISPGPILFPGGSWEQMGQDIPDWVEKKRQQVALKRLGKPEEIANAALFLASPLSSYVTGTNMLVDGGITIGTSF